MTRPRRLLLLSALALATACKEHAKPEARAIQVTGGPLATSERGSTATLEVRLSVAPTADVDLDVLTGDAAEGLLLAPGATVPAPWIALHFTPANWATSQAVTVVGVDDAIADGDVRYQVRLAVNKSADAGYAEAAEATVTVVNHDDDRPAVLVSRTQLQTAETGNRSGAFDVVLATQPSSTFSVFVTSDKPSEGLLFGGLDPLTASDHVLLLFTPSNWSVPQTVTVVGQPDQVVDGDQTYLVWVEPDWGDPVYVALLAQQITVVNHDTDVARVLLSPGPLTVVEGSVTSFSVRLGTIPAVPVTIPITSADASEALLAGPSDPGKGPSTSLTFDATDWDQPQSVFVYGQLDQVVDGPKHVVITVGRATGDLQYAALPAQLVDATVLDADLPGFLWSIGGYALQTSEAGATSTLQLALSAAPLADVTVPVASSDPLEALVSLDGAPLAPSLTLTFTPADWFTSRTITVSGVDDAIFEPGPPHPFNVIVGPTQSDSPFYDGVSGFTVPGLNVDDEVGVSQGTAAVPVEVTGLLPFASQVGTGSSFYRVPGFPNGGWVGVKDTYEPVVLTAWSDGPSPVKLCTAPSLYHADSSCAVRPPPGGAVVLEVSGASTARGATFTLYANPYVFSNDPPQAIPDGSYAVSSLTLSVLGALPVPQEMAILFEVTHPQVAELQVSISAPWGYGYGVVGLTGGGADFDSTVLATSGVLYVGVGTGPFADVYRPAVPLPVPADGTWTLTVRDGVVGNIGTLVRWGIAVR